MTTIATYAGTGTDIGPRRDRFEEDRSLRSGAGRDRSSRFVASCARAKRDLEATGPYRSLLVRQGPIGTDYPPYDGSYAHAPKAVNPQGTDNRSLRSLRSLWITR